MSSLRAITVGIRDLFDLFDETLLAVPPEHRGNALSAFCSLLKKRHNVAQNQIDEAVRMVVLKEDCKNGFVGAGGVVRRREIVATRTVPVSQPEEMGENGLMWRDVRR